MNPLRPPIDQPIPWGWNAYYTMTLGEILSSFPELPTTSGELTPGPELLDQFPFKRIGLGDYPIFNEEYRKILNTKICTHYYFSEIGLETVQQFTHRMRAKMWEIMPYFNQLYKDQFSLYENDPTKEWESHKTGTSSGEGSGSSSKTTSGTNSRTTSGTSSGENSKTTSGTSSGESSKTTEGSTSDVTTSTLTATNSDTTTTENSHLNLYSDTPQGSTLADPTADKSYLTNARKETANDSQKVSGINNSNGRGTSEGTTSGTEKGTTSGETSGTEKGTTSGTTSGTESGSTSGTENGTTSSKDSKEYQEDNWGRNTSFAKLIEERRDAFLNVDMMVIKALRPLFMGIY